MSSITEKITNTRLRALIQDVFDNPENGTPDNISQSGCVALAKQGYEAWNAWREAFPVVKIIEAFKANNTANFSGLALDKFTFVSDERLSNQLVEDDNIDNQSIEFGVRDICFENFNFGANSQFNGAKFKDSVNFIGAKFDGETTFEKAVFHRNANFQNAEFFSADFKSTVFLNSASFNQAKFSEDATFNRSKFTKAASFIKTEFNEVSFEDVVFDQRAVFWWAKFQTQDNFNKRWVSFCNTTFNYVAFDNAQFLFEVDFTGAKFKSAASFDQVFFGFSFYLSEVKFSGSVSFKGACFPTRISFQDITFEKSADFGGVDLNKLPDMLAIKTIIDAKGLAPNDFLQIEFLGCQFKGEVNFSNRIFKNSCTFGSIPNSNTSDSSKVKKTIFAKAPKFHNCELHQDTSFDGAEFPEATGKEESARAYRTLKLAFNKMQGVREEQKFFKLEMAEEAKRATCWRRFLFSAYKNLSDYGFSIGLPILYLILSSIIFASVYRLLSCYAQWSIGSSCEFNPRFLEFVILQPLPLPGLEKLIESLKSEIFLISNYESVGIFVVNSWLNVTITILTILQKSLSLLFFFLIGLALKNQFKFKFK